MRQDVMVIATQTKRSQIQKGNFDNQTILLGL